MADPQRTETLLKDRIAGSLHRHIWIEQAVLVLLYDRRFRYAFLAIVLLLALGLGTLLRIWRVTPEGFLPRIRINALDYFQSLNLARTAGRADAAHDGPECLAAWAACIANNPANLDHVRSHLNALGEFGERRRHSHLAAQQTAWLLRLGQTNSSDIALGARILHAFWLNAELLALLRPREETLSPDLRVLYAQALFVTGDHEGFSRYLPEFHRLARSQPHSEAALFYQAYCAGWTQGPSEAEGQRAVDEAKADPRFAFLAHRLQFAISIHRGDPRAYAESLDALTRQGDAWVSDHVLYWRLLAQNGQRDTAIECINTSALIAQHPDEAILLARARYELGLGEESRTILRQYSRLFPDSESLWLCYANLLVEQRQWDELFEVGVQLRSRIPPGLHDLQAFSFFLQGLACHYTGRKAQADEALARAASHRVTSQILGAKMADTLNTIGYPERAQQVLTAMRASASNDPDYWQMVAQTAFQLRDTSLLVFASATLYKMRPEHRSALQDYAAALLTTRSLPAEAIKLTFLHISREPDSVPARLNHASALAQNRRLAEARDVLASLDPTALSVIDRNAARLVWFDVYFASGEDARALTAAETLDRSLLFPPEIAWLDHCLEQIQARAKTRLPTNSPAPPKS